jgi:quinol monooxygenase YgiN
MYVVYAQFTAKSGHELDVANLINDFAQVVREEPGNESFEVYVQAETPGRFFVFEKYADEGAFRTHVRAAPGQIFNRALNPLIVEPHSQLTMLRST